MPRVSAPAIFKEGEEEDGDDDDDDKEVVERFENEEEGLEAAEAGEKNDIDIAGELRPDVDETAVDEEVTEDEAIKRYVLAHLA
jgi:hypothetical protein